MGPEEGIPGAVLARTKAGGEGVCVSTEWEWWGRQSLEREAKATLSGAPRARWRGQGNRRGLQSLEAKALCCARAGCVGAGGPLAGALLEEQR